MHIQKTAGRSLIELLLRETPDARRFLGTHDHARWAKESLGDDWPRYFKFAFVRNPWDRLVSWYTAIKQNTAPIPKYQRLLRLKKHSRFRQYVLERARSFEEFVVNCDAVVDDFDGRKSVRYNQLDYLTDENGEIIVDFIGRFENLKGDAEKVLKRLGMEDETLPHVGKSRHRHYSEYYDDKTRDLVAEMYRRDAEFFGYEFERAFSEDSP